MAARFHALRPILKSTTFRLTLLAAGVFVACAVIVLAVIVGSSVRAVGARVDATLASEIAELRAVDREKGVNGVNRAVLARTLDRDDVFYLLAYPDGRRLSGPLPAIPDRLKGREGTVRFALPAAGENRAARGRIIQLSGGHQLLVWQDVTEGVAVVRRILRSAAWAFGLMALLALGGGAVVSQRFARRVDALNGVARTVMAGDLGVRAPRNHSGDELDELSANLNAMLERIEGLMTAARHSGDAIAHDLRTPLTRLRAHMESALIDERGDPREALETALSGADELLVTFNTVLRLARLEAGEKRPALTPMDPAAIVADLAELYEPACEEAGIAFFADIAHGLTVRADAALLAQALANLLDNAVKYTPEGGTVSLTLAGTSDGGAAVTVADDGPGVPEGDRERVFARFVRLDASRSEPGTGLGLSLVKAAADVHGASVALSEAGPVANGRGPGLKATLTLPAPDAARWTPTPAVAPSSRQEPGATPVTA